jgi:A/G-specific adenine glycosylase
MPHAVVDGNVTRVLARVFGIETDITQTATKKTITDLASRMLDMGHPAAYNQAIMDFGALQCTPANPDCAACPMQDICMAFELKKVGQIPFKKPKQPKQVRYLHFLIAGDDHHLLLSHRTARDIWQGLYTFPAIENITPLKLSQLKKRISAAYGLPENRIKPTPVAELKQELTHQRVYGIFYTLPLDTNDMLHMCAHGLELLPVPELVAYTLPKIMVSFIKKYYALVL